jgi:hypothetical protein
MTQVNNIYLLFSPFSPLYIVRRKKIKTITVEKTPRNMRIILSLSILSSVKTGVGMGFAEIMGVK